MVENAIENLIDLGGKIREEVDDLRVPRSGGGHFLNPRITEGEKITILSETERLRATLGSIKKINEGLMKRGEEESK